MNEANKTDAATSRKSDTLFPEIWGKWGIFETETPEERAERGPLIERKRNAVKTIKRLKGWERESWNLRPIKWLEAKADELREKREAERAAQASKDAAQRAQEAPQGDAGRARAKAA